MNLVIGGDEKIPLLSDALVQANRAAADVRAVKEKADRLPLGAAERKPAEAVVTSAETARNHADDLKRQALASAVILPRLLQELRFPEISNAKAGEILALLVNCHSLALNAVYIPDLIESLRTQNEVVRLETRKALVALSNVDYPSAKTKDLIKDLAKWEPKKSETASDIDQWVRQWRSWWSAAQVGTQT